MKNHYLPLLKRQLLFLYILLFSVSSLWAAPPPPDVRLLIDVSGSMRQNDPQNLRIPALRLVNELLPLGAAAGVWLFADKTEALVPPAVVNEAWKTRTRSRLERIHSRGALTDIEQALTAGLSGWEASKEATDRHLVLLTDGLVDVGKDPAQSAASRQRILSEQLARLRALQVKVHAVALSDAVDAELLRTLTSDTGGWLEKAADADALQRIFLHMLEQAAAPTTVPLSGNQFQIDGQVSEFTLLAFRSGEVATALITPDGKTISGTKPAPDVLWREEEGYDLVTLTKPQPGRWQLQGVSDPDNRVVVVTDLGLELEPLPGVLPHGTRLQLAAWLTDHQQPVTRQDLLQLVTATATLTALPEENAGAETAPQMEPVQVRLELDAKTGRYHSELETTPLLPGSYQLQMTLDSGTFQRQLAKRLRLIGAPLTVTYQVQLPTEVMPTAAIVATLAAEVDMVDLTTLSGYLRAHSTTGQQVVLDIPQPTTQPLVLTLPITHPGSYRVEGRLLARSHSGELIDVTPAPQQIEVQFAAPADTASDAPLSWLDVSLYVVLGNVLLSAFLGLTWWLLRRSKQRALAAQTITSSAMASA